MDFMKNVSKTIKKFHSDGSVNRIISVGENNFYSILYDILEEKPKGFIFLIFPEKLPCSDFPDHFTGDF